MAMVLMKQLNYDVCDKINKVCMEEHKRQKIIDDYEIFINSNYVDDDDEWNCFYNLEIEIDFKNVWYPIRDGTDKDDMFKKFQIVKDYINLNIDDNILSVKLFMKRGFVDGEGKYCWWCLDQDSEIIDYHNVPIYEDDCRYYNENDDFNEDEFITHYNEMKDLYDNDELDFYDAFADDYGDNIIFNKW